MSFHVSYSLLCRSSSPVISRRSLAASVANALIACNALHQPASMAHFVDNKYVCTFAWERALRLISCLKRNYIVCFLFDVEPATRNSSFRTNCYCIRSNFPRTFPISFDSTRSFSFGCCCVFFFSRAIKASPSPSHVAQFRNCANRSLYRFIARCNSKRRTTKSEIHNKRSNATQSVRKSVGDNELVYLQNRFPKRSDVAAEESVSSSLGSGSWKNKLTRASERSGIVIYTSPLNSEFWFA